LFFSSFFSPIRCQSAFGLSSMSCSRLHYCLSCDSIRIWLVPTCTCTGLHPYVFVLMCSYISLQFCHSESFWFWLPYGFSWFLFFWIPALNQE
jgi:hypothetical protein